MTNPADRTDPVTVSNLSRARARRVGTRLGESANEDDIPLTSHRHDSVTPRRARTGSQETRYPGKKSSTKQAPPEQTNAENFYYLKQMNARTPMVIIMTDGEEIRGWIEWYDRACLKVNREGAPNLLIQKHWIKYLFKEEELNQPPEEK